jgi:nucleoside 2-deoxyribosyltransferase
MAKVYVAGPLFNTHERWYLERISEALEQAGFQTYLPHRDAGILKELSDGERRRIFHADLNALNECDFCVALLTGVDHDSGTSLELGYLYSRNKTCFGITDDKRWMNNMIWGVCGEGKNIVSRIEDLIPLIGRVIPG